MISLRRKKILDFLIALLVSYAAILLFFYVMQRSFIYVPDISTPDPAFFGMGDMDTVRVKTDDGLTLQGWYKTAKKGKPVILMFHGNAGHIGIRAFKARPFLERGYGFLLAEYRAYGGNRGTISEEGLYKDASAYIKFLNESGVPSENIILYGESLGTGIAIQMAVEYPSIKAVVLEAPYTAMYAVAQKHMFMLPVSLMMKDRYDSIKKIGRVTAPVLIFNGKRDNIVPPVMGQKLYDAANEPKTMEVFPMAGHNDLYLHGAAGAALKFLEYLEKP